MILIAGLGNPEKKYEKTRHNVGFMVLDALALDLGVTWKEDKKRNAMIAKYDYSFPGQREKVRVILAKPLTYMNRSGDAIRKIAEYYQIKPKNIWIVHDDIDINLGNVRIRFGGSSAGQKGIQSIIDNIGNGFYRFRVGIGTEKSNLMPSEKFVLSKFSRREKKIIDDKIEEIIGFIKKYIESGPKETTI